MVRMSVVPWPPPMKQKNGFSSPRQPPPSMRASARGSLCQAAGSGNRLPVLDSEAPKLPIHTAIAVPQYGTQGSVGHLAALPIWRLSPLRTWIPATLGSATAADPPPEPQPCAMSANYLLVLVNRLAGAFHCPVASKTARRSGNRPALCRRLGVRPAQHRRERLGDLLVAGVVGMQTVGPTNQIPRTK
jgi:hypothetical protein